MYKNCKQIIINYLKVNGYRGLYNYQMDCGCNLDDLIPCAECFDECVPAYEYKCKCENEKHSFHMSPLKHESGKPYGE